MFDSLLTYLDKFGPELLVIQFGFLIILFTLFLWLWFSNRRKYHNLKHAIPAKVVKDYLDSIIQNSTSLKSSLFRGGGLDTTSVPSVMPLANLTGGDGLGVSGAQSTALLEELNQKKALIASLEAQLAASSSSVEELSAKIKFNEGQLGSAQARIKELENLLAQRNEGDEEGPYKAEIENLTQQRDEAVFKLKEFEIIADDLANLKRLQQENAQLKRSLEARGEEISTDDSQNELSKADVSDLLEDLGQSEELTQEDNEALNEFLSSDEPVSKEESPATETLEEVLEAKDESEDKPKSEKTPEDLLSEFEKMLG